MEFKKTFSSNLHNLSVKKTVKMVPPTSDQPSGQSHYSPRYPTPDSLRDSKASSDKENQLQGSNVMQGQHSYQGKRQGFTKEKERMSPMLTFHKARKQQVMSQQANLQGSRTSREISNYRSRSTLKDEQPNHFGLLNSGGKPSIRLGSMLFASMNKKEGGLSQWSSAGRESRSFDRIKTMKTEISEVQKTECLNQDGRIAKYRVLKRQDDDEQPLSYCLQCTIPLVRQGFDVEEIAPDQRLSVSQKRMSSNSSVGTRSISNSRRRPLLGSGDRSDMGEHLKCKIILKLNQLKADREQFMASYERSIQSIDYYYDTLADSLEQRRMSEKQELTHLRNMHKMEGENYENRLGSYLGTVDYMLRSLQGFTSDYVGEVQGMVQREIEYPTMRVELDPQPAIEQLGQILERFGSKRASQLRREKPMRMSEPVLGGSHPMRFSFEEALTDSRKQKGGSTMERHSRYQNLGGIDPLQQENESELDESWQGDGQNNQNAFRNLFPQGQEEEVWERQSPVFKQF